MTLNVDPTKRQLERLLGAVQFYLENPITELYSGVKFSTWEVAILMALGEKQETLQGTKETILNLLAANSSDIPEEQKDRLINSIPPNMQELVDDYKRYEASRNLTEEERTSYLDDLIKRAGTANESVFRKWEEQRLKNVKSGLRTSRDAFKKQQNKLQWPRYKKADAICPD